ncbi:hypothetical protein ACLBX9_09665 [Methylobacterium sp. A49B]
MPGATTALRAYLADGFRTCRRGALWLAEAIAVAADVTDPACPESIRRPRAWAGRLLQLPSESH